jgi:hypothetical protein
VETATALKANGQSQNIIFAESDFLTTVENSTQLSSGAVDYTVGTGQGANPILTIAAPTQVSGTTKMTLTGTVADVEATTVEVLHCAAVLGAATVSNGTWAYANIRNDGSGVDRHGGCRSDDGRSSGRRDGSWRRSATAAKPIPPVA